MIRRFREIGVQTWILSPPMPLSLSRREGRYLNLPLRLVQKVLNLIKLFFARGISLAIYLRQNRIDCIHLNNSVTRNHDWMLGSMLASVKCITHERGINARYSHVTRFFARRVAAIICISNAVRERLEAKHVGGRNLFVVYNGLDPDRVVVTQRALHVRRLYQVEADAPIVGIVGNIREWKGQHVVAAAVHTLKKRHPRIRCLMVGDTSVHDQPYRERLEAQICQLGLEENIIFTGYQQNVADYMNAMDVVIHASVEPEPFGRVLLEAMALSKPLVGSRSGAVPEIIEDGKTGLTFKVGDPEELADCIHKLLSDRTAAARMGQAGRARLEREFHIRRNVESTEALYKDLL
jgi:glycosyltransferase involved in cell wall biosynthesis